MRVETVDLTYLSASAFSGVGAILTALSDIAIQVFGVPLPVLLAAAAGAFLARSYLPSVGTVRALGGSTVWTVVGCALAPIIPAIAGKFGLEVPTGALAGSALVVSAGAPLLWPVVVDNLPRLAKRWFDRLSGGSNGNS